MLSTTGSMKPKDSRAEKESRISQSVEPRPSPDRARKKQESQHFL